MENGKIKNLKNLSSIVSKSLRKCNMYLKPHLKMSFLNTISFLEYKLFSSKMLLGWLLYYIYMNKSMQLIDWHIIKKSQCFEVFFPFSVTHRCYSCGWLLRHPIIIDSKNLAPRRSKNWERMLLCAKGLRKRTDIFKIKIGICNPVQEVFNMFL